jgi:uncharacterized protein
MKSAWCVSVIALHVSALGVGCATAPVAPAVDTPMMAWRVSGGDLPAPSYLVGSFHLSRDTSWLVPELEAALSASDHVAFELDAAARADEMEAFTLRDGLYPQGETLEQHVPAPLHAAVMARASEVGLPGFVAERMKPWLINVTLPVLAMKNEGYDPEKGVDQVLLARAKAKGKHIVELEKVEDQLSLLKDQPEDLVLLQLEAAMKKDDGQELAAMASAWHAGNAVELARMLQAARNDEPRLEGFMRAMFDLRNDAMVANALPLMRGAPTMVVVGAGHMLNERGIIAQLQAQGYVVEQMVAKSK